MLDALQWIADWIAGGADGTGGITGLFTDFATYMLGWYIKAKIDFMLWAIPFFWNIAKGVLEGLDAANYISVAFNALPVAMADALRFFGIDQAITMGLTASVTKYGMRMVGL